jgi:hypothetical protein
MAIMANELEQETLDMAWVNRYCKGFELRCNKCKQFPHGFYEFDGDVHDAKSARKVLLEKLASRL